MDELFENPDLRKKLEEETQRKKEEPLEGENLPDPGYHASEAWSRNVKTFESSSLDMRNTCGHLS
jgi:hypothetical protein